MTQEPEKPKLTWEEKITDILLKAIMTGGIGVGGANAFWELFIKSDIPKAIASALIGAGISYGAKMLMPIHKCNEERADSYQQLEEYLKAKEWRKADKETYRLMITAVGKDDGQGFSEDDFRNFPCDELLAINHLWVEHSDGLYGFSVQKQIYMECGGKLNFTYSSNETWSEFCDRVAWKDDLGEYLFGYSGFKIYGYKKFKNSGHFPTNSNPCREYLFSRIASCEL